MPSSNGFKGTGGEERAATFLSQAGLRVVSRNVRLPGGEIDLICRDGATVVFVEVKARWSHRFGSALSAVDARKRRTLRKIAADYMQIVAPERPFRFDVVAIDNGRLRHYKDAF